MKVFVENTGNFTLTDKDYLAAGGEGKIYSKNGLAFKIYHDENRVVPIKKIEELNKIKKDNVLKPLNIIYDLATKKPLGFTMSLLMASNPLCKLFVKTFKERSGIGHQDIADLVKEMQKTVIEIHKEKCLIADFNEMNVVVDKNNKIPYFIDVDSWQTPSFKATAISDSIRDRKVPFGTFSELTDWYAFAILAFQMYINIHPYRGTHPKYKNNDIDSRMNDGISVFEKDIKLPPICYDFSVIPKPHLEWFKDIFSKNNRSLPPMPDSIMAIPVIHEIINIIRSHGNFEVEKIFAYDSTVREVYNIMGTGYVITDKSIYKGGKKIVSDIEKHDKVLLCESDDMIPVICYLKNNEVSVTNINGDKVGDNFAAKDIMYCNGAIYSISNDIFQENTFKLIGSKLYRKIKIAGRVAENSSKMFEGCVYQDLLGKPWFQIPYEQNLCYFQCIKELEGYRVIEAKREKNYLIVIAEKNGFYNRFVFIFDKKFTSYTCRIVDKIAFENINFTVLHSGVCLLVAGNEIELFIDNKTIKTLQDPPFDSSMKIYSTSSSVYFINNKEICSAKMVK